MDRVPPGAALHPAGPRFDERFQSDLADSCALREWLDERRPDVIVHLAGPADVPASFAQPEADFRAQLLPFISLLEAVRGGHPACRVILVSSAAIYGNPAEIPVRENAQTAPISPYGWHKLQQEVLLDEYVRVFGIRAVKVRLFSVYGEGQRRLAVWDLCRKALAGDTVVLGTGCETRDYLHAADVGRALAIIAGRAAFEGEALNVASGCETRVADLAREIYLYAASALEPVFGKVPAVSGSPHRWCAEISRVRALGFEPGEGLSSGLKRTVAWIREQS